ncbi:MAG: hypothetical protein ABSH28_16965 [Acidobacteriota bacterium]|jgi:ATP-binding cassette subfamily B protein
MKQAVQELFRCMSLIGRGLRLVWQSTRGWTVAWSILLLAQGLLPAGLIYLTRITIDCLATALTSRERASVFAPLWLPDALIALISVLGLFLSSLLNWVRTAQAELVYDHVQSMIHDQALALDLEFYENINFYDLLHRARVDAHAQPIALLESLGSLVQNRMD